MRIQDAQRSRFSGAISGELGSIVMAVIGSLVDVSSADGAMVHYEVSGTGDTALVFVHGWMGNVRWWDAQRDAFAAEGYRVVAIDLVGHGASDKTRAAWTAEAYAADIAAVVRAVAAPRVILVGHSMSGAYVIAAAPAVEHLAAIVLVDTLKNLAALPTLAQVTPMLATYRADYATAVETMLRTFLFAPATPPPVVARLKHEFLGVSGDVASTLLEPLYRYDVRRAARDVRVPVRGIDTDLHPNDAAANRAVFADYAITTIPGFGHYPMLECPALFTAALRATLAALGM
jgi:pimeloyl-ACP methyl ester carboxylesterase